MGYERERQLQRQQLCSRVLVAFAVLAIICLIYYWRSSNAVTDRQRKQAQIQKVYHGKDEDNEELGPHEDVHLGRKKETGALKRLDVLCHLPMDEGKGNSRQPMWHYDPTAKACKKFDYLGEGGNDNRFVSMKQCDDSCGCKFQSAETIPACVECRMRFSAVHGGCFGGDGMHCHPDS